MNKVVDPEALGVLAAAWHNEGLRLGFTCGAFDLLHAGHVDYLEKAREVCDRLIVAVNSDASIRQYKNPLRPIVSERQRMRVVSALSCVDAVVLMHDPRPLRLIELLRPEYYIKGGDYHPAALRSSSAVEAYGGKVVVIPITEEISSTTIIERIQATAMYSAPEALPATPGSPIIMLDRDGTIIQNVPFLSDPSRVKLLPNVGENLKTLQDAGFLLVVVTNQQGIGLGYFDYDAFVSINSEMLRQLDKFSVRIARFYYCPHSLADGCECRKPAAGLLTRAMADFKSRPADCFMIGDSPSDIEAAKNAGCQGYLISESGHSLSNDSPSFEAAVQHILEHYSVAVPEER